MYTIHLCYIRDMNRYGYMSRKVKLSNEELAWLKSNHDKFSHHDLAERYSCCVDTIKRILMRLNLQYFPGAKYQTRPTLPTWKRPCLMCGSTISRPRNQYKCDDCSQGEFERSSTPSVPKAPYKPKVPF